MNDDALRAEFERAAREPVTVDLTTVGRRSGQPQRIEIWIVNVDGRLVIGGTPGPRDWMANVRSEPTVVLHVKEGALADLPGAAAEITDVGVRRVIYTHPSTAWYRSQSTVDELVAAAPTIAITITSNDG